MTKTFTALDVITDPSDQRIKIGVEYFCANSPEEVVANAYKNSKRGKLLNCRKDSKYPFMLEMAGGDTPLEENYKCIIPCGSLKRWIPYDITKPEVRNALRGAWIVYHPEENVKYEYMIFGFVLDGQDNGVLLSDGGKRTPKQLLEFFRHLDGSPCGVLMEE